MVVVNGIKDLLTRPFSVCFGFLGDWRTAASVPPVGARLLRPLTALLRGEAAAQPGGARALVARLLGARLFMMAGARLLGPRAASEGRRAGARLLGARLFLGGGSRAGARLLGPRAAGEGRRAGARLLRLLAVLRSRSICCTTPLSTLEATEVAT